MRILRPAPHTRAVIITRLRLCLAPRLGLRSRGVLDHLCGKLVFMAVPAEEYVEVGFRQSLRDQGTIEFLGGKPEFIRLGAFDDVDFAMLVHTSSRAEDGIVCMTETSNGTVAKHVTYHGRAAHAAGAPHRGINALNAATSGFHGNPVSARNLP